MFMPKVEEILMIEVTMKGKKKSVLGQAWWGGEKKRKKSKFYRCYLG